MLKSLLRALISLLSANAEAAFFSPVASVTFGFDDAGLYYLTQVTFLLSPGDVFGELCFSMSVGGTTAPLLVNGGSNPCNSYRFGGISVAVKTRTAPYGAFLSVVATHQGQVVASLTSGQPPPPPPPPPDPNRSLRIRAALFDEVAAPAAGQPLPVSARVPLGAIVTLEALDNNGVQVPAAFTLGTAALNGVIDAAALFPGMALYPYAVDTANLRRFQAAHLGTVTLTVTPSDAGLVPGTIAVTVESPASLGSEGADVDADVVTTANRTGMPPQYIKAHVWKESFPKWNRFTYRYEPIGPGGDLMTFFEGPHLRTVTPFSDYRLATQLDARNTPLPQGALLADADRNPRATLRIGCDAAGQNGVPIGAGATGNPTAWEIFRCNDRAGARMNWSTAAGSFGAARVARLQASPFTAQTPLAASYGLLQVTYLRAVERAWTGADGPKNPSALFDTPSNIAADSNSLLFGTREVRRVLVLSARQAGVPVPPTSPGGLIPLLLTGWSGFNPGERDYGAIIALKAESLRPASQASILGTP